MGLSQLGLLGIGTSKGITPQAATISSRLDSVRVREEVLLEMG